MPACPACTAPVPGGFRFCPSCGAPSDGDPGAGPGPGEPAGETGTGDDGPGGTGEPTEAEGSVGCLYCHTGITGAIARCRSCGSSYHPDCFDENGGCALASCDLWTGRVTPGSVSPLVSGAETAPAPDGSDTAEPPADPEPAGRTQTVVEPEPPAEPEPPPPPAAVNFCDQCGAAAVRGAQFCRHCGQPLLA